jgi:hypothetical protein
MKVAKTRAVTLTGFVMSSLLLVLVANCSLEKPITDEPVDQQGQGEPVVANQFCFACHYDFEEEEFAADHKLAGIGCERCHGESMRHRSDEANVTPPDLMYPKERINPTCMMCHPRHEINQVPAHEPLLAGAETIFDEAVEDSASANKVKYCTECHARKHRMKVRTVRWDKATGEVLQ